MSTIKEYAQAVALRDAAQKHLDHVWDLLLAADKRFDALPAQAAKTEQHATELLAKYSGDAFWIGYAAGLNREADAALASFEAGKDAYLAGYFEQLQQAQAELDQAQARLAALPQSPVDAAHLSRFVFNDDDRPDCITTTARVRDLRQAVKPLRVSDVVLIDGRIACAAQEFKQLVALLVSEAVGVEVKADSLVIVDADAKQRITIKDGAWLSWHKKQAHTAALFIGQAATA